MHLSTALLLASTASALFFPSIPRSLSLLQVDSILTAMFLDTSTGKCSDDARAAIRETFHNCGTWNKAQGSTGGYDGSLILAPETGRGENNGLQDISTKLLACTEAKPHAIVTCPGGPRMKTYVGRKGFSNPASNALLPNLMPSTSLPYRCAFHLAATSRRLVQGRPGAGQYSRAMGREVLVGDPPPSVNVFVLPSDTALANQTSVSKEFKIFVNNAGGSSNLADCTNYLPSSTNAKREMSVRKLTPGLCWWRFAQLDR
ncbi:uncharacterized protein BDZ99DRAFT_523849 [Mytilinidion resinicola]|uniref:Uncharacterized protein n=1 Tax=Mytilinidion resinicola TaxID=574789 RepID=A0A6A6YCV3_9PEZI|nr:uncharacterized protein BDZ99DRAFT_523849 [Mytilinidion resinicola]KAF2806398.1 hypothetical protein BDZ99DRAFT_523849 [Mytilinidion resinicola]